MLSRVAESIYWMSRYLERAENLARIIDVHSNFSLDLPGEENDNWSALAQATGDYEAFKKRYPSEHRHQVIQFLAFDRENGNSILCCVAEARENARSIREIISPVLWEQINRLYHLLHRTPTDPAVDPQHFYDFFHEIIVLGLSFGGIVNDTMAHTEGWHWFRCGRLLERADKTSRILDVKYFTILPDSEKVGTSVDQIQWTGLLKSTNSIETYRTLYGSMSARNIVEFLVLNRTFPRSILHCLVRAEESLRNVLGTFPNHYQNHAEQRLGQLCSEVSYSSVDSIMSYGLHEYVDKIQASINQVGSAIDGVYFSA